MSNTSLAVSCVHLLCCGNMQLALVVVTLAAPDVMLFSDDILRAVADPVPAALVACCLCCENLQLALADPASALLVFMFCFENMLRVVAVPAPTVLVAC